MTASSTRRSVSQSRSRRVSATQQRSAVRARAAGLPATPLAVTAADVLAWDRARGEPPPRRGPSPAEEDALLAVV